MSSATNALLTRLKSLYPVVTNGTSGAGLANPWYIVAAVAFSASNEPEAVPAVFKRALEDVGTDHDQRLLLARKMRDALFKSGLTSGYSRAINSLVALHEVMPSDMQDTKTLRSTSTPIEEHERHGREVFQTLYGETAGSVQTLLDTIYPDLGWFSNTIGYGLTYGFNGGVLSSLETSYVLVASLIATDTPRQINWHLDGARRNGATLEQVKAVRQIAMEAASAVGVKWKNGVPEVKE